MTHNIDARVAKAFGEEWSRFDQSLLDEELNRIFADYFSVFPWQKLPEDAVGADIGCGSGRWAKLVAPRVGKLHCIDASGAALEVARKNLSAAENCSFSIASVDAMPIADASLDFAYSLGVLHHVPDTHAAIRSCVQKLKPGAPLLLYLYYRFDNRPQWFRYIWLSTEPIRWSVSRLPERMRYATCEAIAALVYWPIARFAKLAQGLGIRSDHFPLSSYRHRAFYHMRTDALDRFGTRLEHRFTRPEIESMMREAGLEDIVFSDRPPYWCAVGYKSVIDQARQ